MLTSSRNATHSLFRYHIEQKAQKFIPGTVETEGITSLAISANRKFVAVAERAEKGMITVYDLHTLKRRKVLTTTDLGSKVRQPKRLTWHNCSAVQHRSRADGTAGEEPGAEGVPGIGAGVSVS